MTDAPRGIAETVVLRIDDLKAHPQNARVHHLPTIKESLQAHGQYRAIVARRARSGKHVILAGHGTWRAARELGWETLHVHLVDVDAEQAKRIVAVDNRAHDRGGYDETQLAELLGSLPSLEGTGYTQPAYDALVARVHGAAKESERVEFQAAPSDDTLTCPSCGHTFPAV